MSASPPPTTGFHLPLLPPELRLKIWDHLLPPRIVQITTSGGPVGRYAQDLQGRLLNSDFKWVPITPNPTALFICRESRALALKLYTTRISLAETSGVIFVDPLHDVVYLLSRRWISHLAAFLVDWCNPETSHPPIQSLAVDAGFLLQHGWEQLSVGKRILKKRGPRMLTLVVESDDRELDSHGPMAVEPFPASQGGGIAFGLPVEDGEWRVWEGYLDRVRAATGRYYKRRGLEGTQWQPGLRVVMARRGWEAQELEWEHCGLEGPVRHDPAWDPFEAP